MSISTFLIDTLNVYSWQSEVNAIAMGVARETVAADIRDREAATARLDARLTMPRPAQPKIEELRAALEDRADEWRATLRAEPKVAPLLLRRLIGPLEMWDPAVPSEEWTEWAASLTPALLEKLAPVGSGVPHHAQLDPAIPSSGSTSNLSARVSLS